MSTPSISNLRRRAAKLGYRFTKSNWRKDSIDNHGGYMIIEIDRSICVDGARYECDLDYVAAFIEEREREEAA